MSYHSLATNGFLHWVDKHPADAQTLTTFALLVVTAFYTVSTWSMARNSRRAQRPYVYVDLIPNDYGTLDFLIANSGNRAAEHVTISMEPVSGTALALIADLPPFADGIRYLPPSRRYQYNLLPKKGNAGGLTFWGPGVPTAITVTLRYRSGRDKFDDRLHVDIAPMNGALIRPFQSPTERVAANLSEINRALRSLRPPTDPFLAVRGTNCPFCLSRVERGARRCKHCLEWINTSDETPEDLSPPEDAGELRTASDGSSTPDDEPSDEGN